MVYDNDAVEGMTGEEAKEYYTNIPIEEFPTGIIKNPTAYIALLDQVGYFHLRVSAEGIDNNSVGITITEHTLPDGRYLHSYTNSNPSPQDNLPEISETPLDAFAVISMMCVAIRETEKNAKIQITGGNRVNEFEKYIDEFPVDVEWEINLKQVA